MPLLICSDNYNDEKDFPPPVQTHGPFDADSNTPSMKSNWKPRPPSEKLTKEPTLKTKYDTPSETFSSTRGDAMR